MTQLCRLQVFCSRRNFVARIEERHLGSSSTPPPQRFKHILDPLPSETISEFGLRTSVMVNVDLKTRRTPLPGEGYQGEIFSDITEE
ncbi:MAG: hypothetical protein MMC33_003116 [Icmadophila ericetorum]|nr:hypothetical protein [Icmadophila ericetorum]